MPKMFSPTVLTANHLIEGHSVFLGPDGWSRKISNALVAQTEEQAEELLALGTRFVRDNMVVGPYLVDIALDGGAPAPLSRREQIRAEGIPTIPVGPGSLVKAA